MTTAAPDLATPEQVLEFSLGEERYCVGIGRVEEIVRAEDLTSLPNSPAQVAGMMDLRGQTTTILDPKRIFEVSSGQSSQQVVVSTTTDASAGSSTACTGSAVPHDPLSCRLSARLFSSMRGATPHKQSFLSSWE
jgi:hypothetical protein